MLCCAVLCCAVLCCAVLCCAGVTDCFMVKFLSGKGIKNTFCIIQQAKKQAKTKLGVYVVCYQQLACNASRFCTTATATPRLRRTPPREGNCFGIFLRLLRSFCAFCVVFPIPLYAMACRRWAGWLRVFLGGCTLQAVGDSCPIGSKRHRLNPDEFYAERIKSA